MTAAFLAIIAKDVNTLLAYLNNLHFSTITSNEKNFSLLLGTEYNWEGGEGGIYIFTPPSVSVRTSHFGL